MKSFFAALLCTLILGLAAPAKAATLPPDPHVKTGGGLPAAPEPNYYVPAGIVTTSFTIVSPTGTSPVNSPCVLIEGNITIVSPGCLFENDISVDGVSQAISQLVFDVSGVATDTITCGVLAGSPFEHCSVLPLGSGEDGFGSAGVTQISFFDGSIPFHTDFSLQIVGFPEHTSFGSTADLTPEPGMLTLLLSGAGALWLRRRSGAKHG